jgi:hypothetical protein
MLWLGEPLLSQINLSSVLREGLLIDSLLFHGLIMKKHEEAGNLPEIVLILIARRPPYKKLARLLVTRGIIWYVKMEHTNQASPTPQVVLQIGFWSALLTTAWILIFNIAIALGASGAPTRSLAMGASLLLTLSFVVLMVSIHNYAPPEKRSGVRSGCHLPFCMPLC